MAYDSTTAEPLSENRRLKGEIGLLAPDAKRYRWLRANMIGVIHLLGRPGIGLSNLTGDGTDAAIDAAMAGQHLL